MTYNAQFMYEQAGEEQEYGWSSTGILDINQLIAGKPYWQKPRAARAKLKKNLIITDLTFPHRSEAYQQRMLDAIEELIQQQYPVFLATENGVIPLSGDIEQIRKQLKSHSPPMASKDGLKKKYIQTEKTRRFTEMNTHILDEHGLYECMKKRTMPRHVSLRYFTSLSEQDQEQYLTLMKSATPLVTVVNVDIIVFGNEKLCKDCTKLIDYFKLSSSESSITTIADGLELTIPKNRHNSQSEELNAFYVGLSEEYLLYEQAEELIVEGNTYDFTEADAHVIDWKNLKTITLDGADFPEQRGFNEAYGALEYLVVTDPPSTQNIEKVINLSAKKLSTLILDSRKKDSTPEISFRKLKDHPGSLPALKVVQISGFEIDNLQDLLIAAPNIEELVITIPEGSYQRHDISFHQLKPGSLSALKRITINGFLIEDFDNLISAICSVERLDMVRSFPWGRSLNTSQDSILTNGALPRLTKLNWPAYNEDWPIEAAIRYGESTLKILNEASNLEDDSRRQAFYSFYQAIDHVKLKTSTVPDTKTKSPSAPIPVPSEPISAQPSTFPEHDPRRMRGLNTQKSFQFKNIQCAKNQGMMIDKFSQYLTIAYPNDSSALIQRIQEGMCFELSHYASMLDMAKWVSFLDEARVWNGKSSSLSEALKISFERLKHLLETSKQSKEKRAFLGDNAFEYLKTHPGTHIIENPWHTIHVRNIGKQWMIYDPNHQEGPLYFNESELQLALKNCLGSLINVYTDNPKMLTPSITSLTPQRFIREGGLLSLISNCNLEDDFINLLLEAEYSADDKIDGLRIENTDGLSAETLCLQSKNPKIYELAIKLGAKREVQSIQKENETETKPEEPKPISPLPVEDKPTEPPKKPEPQAQPISEPPQKNEKKEAPAQIQKDAHGIEQQKFDPAIYEAFFKPEVQSAQKDLLAYGKDIVQAEHLKQRIEVVEPYQTEILCDVLRQYAIDTKKPVFYINSPDELVCSAPYISSNKHNVGTLRNGPGGKLYDFLKNNQDPILVINYDAFKPDDIARLNTLLDPEPKIDHVSISKSCKIIGVCSKNHPDYYAGCDFTSRFNKNHVSSINDEEWSRHQRVIPKQQGQETTSIELFQYPNWEAILFGYWKIDGRKLTFEEGELEKAIKKGLPIEFKHAPWSDERFQRDVLAKLPLNARIIEQPKKEEDYAWAEFAQVLDRPTGDEHPDYLLNPGSLHTFFSHSNIQKNQCKQKLGIFSGNKGKTIRLLLTAACREDDIARLLDMAQKDGIRLQLSALSGVDVPQALQDKIGIIPQTVKDIKLTRKIDEDAVIYTQDMDVTLETLKQLSPNAIVINVSECTGSDLFQLTQASIKYNWFNFTQREAGVSRLLGQGQTVVLKGAISPELRDELTKILHQRDKYSKGQLIILTEDKNNVPYGAHQWSHEGNGLTRDKINLISREFLNETKKASHNIAQLRAMKALDDPWAGIQDVPRPKIDDALMDLKDAEAKSKQFMQERLDKLNQILAKRKFAFITGLTGVGKSTFVETVLKHAENTVVYHGENSIKKWAKDSSSQRKILFIDEANLLNRQWSEFDSLHETPPHIYLNGEYIQLDDSHRVVFAGNPLSYGEGRQIPPIFTQHGNACLFEPLPSSVIYHHILKPITDDEEIVRPILAVYQFLVNHSTTDILITPRELQMMALLAKNEAKRSRDVTVHTPHHPSQREGSPKHGSMSQPRRFLATLGMTGDQLPPEKDMAAYYAYHLAKTLVPKEHLDEFNQLFKPHQEIHEKEVELSGHHLTSSRQHFAKQFNALLALRTYRRTEALNDAQKYGGLGGIVLEGEAGIGKSELVTQLLIANGNQEKDILKPYSWKAYFRDCLYFILGVTIPEKKIFYRIPASLSTRDTEKALLKAFDEGAIAIMDEINSRPMMERLQNALLMGRTLDNKQPKNPGFLLIGIQNPVTYAGRRAASQALQHRLMAEALPPYTKEEMHEILTSKGVEEPHANAMLEAYEKYEMEIPKPTFRDLMHCADAHITAKKALLSASERETHSVVSRFTFFSKFGRKTHATPDVQHPVDFHLRHNDRH